MSHCDFNLWFHDINDAEHLKCIFISHSNFCEVFVQVFWTFLIGLCLSQVCRRYSAYESASCIATQQYYHKPGDTEQPTFITWQFLWMKSLSGAQLGPFLQSLSQGCSQGVGQGFGLLGSSGVWSASGLVGVDSIQFLVGCQSVGLSFLLAVAWRLPLLPYHVGFPSTTARFLEPARESVSSQAYGT